MTDITKNSMFMFLLNDKNADSEMILNLRSKTKLTMQINGPIDATFMRALAHQKHIRSTRRSIRGVHWTLLIHSAYFDTL